MSILAEQFLGLIRMLIVNNRTILWILDTHIIFYEPSNGLLTNSSCLQAIYRTVLREYQRNLKDKHKQSEETRSL